jgi:hypothetical protein
MRCLAEVYAVPSEVLMEKTGCLLHWGRREIESVNIITDGTSIASCRRSKRQPW